MPGLLALVKAMIIYNHSLCISVRPDARIIHQRVIHQRQNGLPCMHARLRTLLVQRSHFEMALNYRGVLGDVWFRRKT